MVPWRNLDVILWFPICVKEVEHRRRGWWLPGFLVGFLRLMALPFSSAPTTTSHIGGCHIYLAAIECFLKTSARVYKRRRRRSRRHHFTSLPAAAWKRNRRNSNNTKASSFLLIPLPRDILKMAISRSVSFLALSISWLLSTNL